MLFAVVTFPSYSESVLAVLLISLYLSFLLVFEVEISLIALVRFVVAVVIFPLIVVFSAFRVSS